MNLAPRLDGPTLSLRPLVAQDRDALHAAASDPETWAGHPAKTRWQREIFDPYFDFLLAAGGTLVVIDRASARMIGASRYYVAPDRPQSIAIGFTFLDRAFWGGATNFEMKRLMLAHAFESYPEVWFHIDPTNLRSQVATTRLGAVHVETKDIDISGKPATWMCFRLDRSAWDATLKDRGA